MERAWELRPHPERRAMCGDGSLSELAHVAPRVRRALRLVGTRHSHTTLVFALGVARALGAVLALGILRLSYPSSSSQSCSCSDRAPYSSCSSEQSSCACALYRALQNKESTISKRIIHALNREEEEEGNYNIMIRPRARVIEGN